MDHPKRKHPRLKSYDYSQNGVYFLTICTINREPLLCTLLPDQILSEEDQLGMDQVRLTKIGEICRCYLDSIPTAYNGVFLDEYVMMPDHIHLLLRIDRETDTGGQGSGRPTVQRIIHGYKRLTSRAAERMLWQKSFYEHVVRNETDLMEIRQYIRRNPAKKLFPT
ncbi:MAG: transposase [Clostridium sp.]|nr:transposase [Clostridium sp.]